MTTSDRASVQPDDQTGGKQADSSATLFGGKSETDYT